MILKVPGVEVESQNRSKIDQKGNSTWDGILISIFHGFLSILEAKLAPSWDRKSIKNQYKKALKNRRQEDDVQEASWSVLEQKYGVDPRTGDGVARIQGPPN